jgi:hypothetical protein
METENRIKELQLRLFSDRRWWFNQFRLLLSSRAHLLIRDARLELSGAELARSQVQAIRLKLLKLGTTIVRNTRRVRLSLSSSFPLRQLFRNCLLLQSNSIRANSVTKKMWPCLQRLHPPRVAVCYRQSGHLKK